MMVYHILSMDKLYGCPYSHFLFWLHLAVCRENVVWLSHS